MKKLSPSNYLKLLQKAKDYLKKDPVVKDMCEEYDFNVDDIDLIPIKFDDIDVSARTDKGVITLNWQLLEDNDFFNNIHYLTHEMLHYIQQSKEPTQSADDGDYLSNTFEQEAFQRQIEFIDNHSGEQEAKEYTNQVLDHHDEKGKERKEKEDILMKLVE